MKTTQEQIEVMQAYEEGKNIRRTHETAVCSPYYSFFTNKIKERFNWDDFDYDIVKEQIVKYVIVDNSTNNTVSTFSNEKEAIRDSLHYSGCRIVKLVQDMDYGELK